MMVTPKPLMTDALLALGVSDFTLEGQPDNEADFTAAFKKFNGVNEHGEAVETDTWGFTWAEVKAKYDELAAVEPLRQLRVVRDEKLAETDWWASSDLTMSAERTAYRQALRDITDTYSSLDDVVWPTKPE